MEGRTAWVETFGCQMNAADSEKMRGILLEGGYAPAAGPESADLLLINTCSIREKAEHKALSLAGRWGALKRSRPGALLVFAGCSAERLGDRVLRRVPEVDAVIGPARLSALPEVLERVRATGAPAVAVGGTAVAADHPAAPVRSSTVKAWVSVMSGCDNACAYCVVPGVRGPERSRGLREIVEEVAALARGGYREVTLLGQNVNSYGRKLDPPTDFPSLLRAIDGESGMTRLRFTTSHPRDFSRELIRAVRDLPTVCEAVHLPLQAGDDEVLRRMNRGYGLAEYLGRVEMLREAVPGVAVTTDVIVGFPGETARQFRRTVEALERIRFDGIFSFRYSPREGTAAWSMGGEVDDGEKAARLMEVQQLQREITEERNRALVGSTQEVLVEGPSRRGGGEVTGRTRSNRIVNFEDPGPVAPGEIVPVRITGAGYLALAGERVGSRPGPGEGPF